MARKDKDAVFLIEQIFKNRKRQYSSLGRDGEPPLKITKEILNQVGDDLGIQEPEDPWIDKIFMKRNLGQMY